MYRRRLMRSRRIKTAGYAIQGDDVEGPSWRFKRVNRVTIKQLGAWRCNVRRRSKPRGSWIVVPSLETGELDGYAGRMEEAWL